jgi:glutamate dehydrogenase/leucine dehydrogenase
MHGWLACAWRRAPQGGTGEDIIMVLLEQMRAHGHEQVIFVQDGDTGLRGIIAIHSTALGPALGGTRMHPYASEDEALRDVLELSRGMTYKASAAGLDLGGGKAVIIGDPAKHKSERLFQSFATFVQRLNGQFYTGEDVGITVADIDVMSRETRFVGGKSPARGGAGDPSHMTASGVLHGMRACAVERWGSESLAGRRVALQGLGKVGWRLAELLQKEQAIVIACDTAPDRASRARTLLGIETVAPKDIHDVDSHIFCPCAMGNAISTQSLQRLRCEIIAGSANNQLEDPAIGWALHERDILYAPDYVINAGGLIQVYFELFGKDRARAEILTRNIAATLRKVFVESRTMGIPTSVAADRIAERRLSHDSEDGKRRGIA